MPAVTRLYRSSCHLESPVHQWVSRPPEALGYDSVQSPGKGLGLPGVSGVGRGPWGLPRWHEA